MPEPREDVLGTDQVREVLLRVFGRYQAESRTISGVYSAESGSDPEFARARRRGGFARAEGRRPRILVANSPARAPGRGRSRRG